MCCSTKWPSPCVRTRRNVGWIVEKLTTEEFIKSIPEEDKYDKYNQSGF